MHSVQEITYYDQWYMRNQMQADGIDDGESASVDEASELFENLMRQSTFACLLTRKTQFRNTRPHKGST